MSIFNNRESFPYTDYHYFNLDYIVTKVNELIEYVRTKTGIPKETADIYYIPKCDGNDPYTGNIKVNIGMEKDNNDNENYMVRPFSPNVTENERGTIGIDGSTTPNESPKVYLKTGILTGIKMWFDNVSKRLNLQGVSNDYDEIKVNGLSNHRVKVTGVADPVTGDGVVNRDYLESNYTDTDGLVLTVNNAMNDVPMYRTGEITNSSAMSKGEIQNMIDESTPETENLLTCSYDVNNPQFLHPTENNIYAMKWRIGNGTTESLNDSYIGFTTYGNPNYGGSVISCLSDGSGFGFMIHREGVEDYIQMRFVPDGNGVYHYPTEFRLGVNQVAVKLANVALPTNEFDGANKMYVDQQLTLLENRIMARMRENG